MKNINIPLYFCCHYCDYKILAMKRFAPAMSKRAEAAFVDMKKHMEKEHPEAKEDKSKKLEVNLMEGGKIVAELIRK